MVAVVHEFVTVDMRGPKAALVASANELRVCVSVLVRKAVALEIGHGADVDGGPVERPDGSEEGNGWVKLSLRMRQCEASNLDVRARAAGISRGAYLAGLVNGVPVLAAGGARPEVVSALTRSCAELSTLSRNVHQLTALLRAGNVPQALLYRDLLDRLADGMQADLRVAAQVLTELRPARRAASASGGAPQTNRRRPWNEV